MDEEEFNEQDTSEQVQAKANKKGLGNLVKDEARKVNNKLKSKIWQAIIKYVGLKGLLIGAAVFALVIILVCILTYTIEATQAKQASTEMLRDLGVEDVRELVEIKQDSSGDGYHLEFIEDFDKKIEKAAKKMGKKYANLGEPELWKYFFLADIATQYPDLGGSGEAISTAVVGNGTGISGIAQKGDFWWPIGSATTTTKNGKTYADGSPEIPIGTKVLSGGVSKGWSSSQHSSPNIGAIDINGDNQIGHYNVISMAKGVVERADDGFGDAAVGGARNYYNGGLGNCVYVRYPGNILIRYMHLAQGTVAVKVGDEVDYGQVLGKMGNSGDSSYPHLHVDMWIGDAGGSGQQDISQYIGESNSNNTQTNSEEGTNTQNTGESADGSEQEGSNEQENSEEQNNEEEESQTTSSSSATSSGTDIETSSEINVDGKEFQGGVKLIRITPNKTPGEISNTTSFKTIEMKYVDNDTFNINISSGNMEAINYFTLSEDTKQIIIAVWTYSEGTTTLETNTIDYLSLIEQFRMPFEYPMIMQIHGGDDEFSKNLAMLAINSKFEIAIIDNVTDTTHERSTTTTHDEDLIASSSPARTTTEEVNTVIELAGVNAWWAKRTSNFASFHEYNEGEVQEKVLDERTIEDGKVQKITSKEQDFKDEYKTYLVTSNYESKEQDFIDIYEKSEFKSTLYTTWLFEFLKNNDSTKNMVELTKYLLYKASGESYGVKDFKDLGLIDRENEIELPEGYTPAGTGGTGSTNASESDLNRLFNFIAFWENGPLWHYMKGDSGYSYNGTEYIYKCVTEDKKNYLCVEDIGRNNGTRNFGFGVMHWHNGTWNNVNYYNEQGIDIVQDKYTKEGSTMPVEIVDRVKTRIIEDKVAELKNTVQGTDLSFNQLGALVAISYQYGNIGDFVSLYKQYGNTDSFKNNYYVNGTRPFIEGSEANGRPQANWTLFHEGKYTSNDGSEL